MIKGFTGEYAFLSNAYPCVLKYERRSYRSAEHAFHACRVADQGLVAAIRRAPTAGSARLLAKQAAEHPDWANRQLEAMRGILQAKFSPRSALAKMLMATARSVLIHQSEDGFWGKPGRNMLGILLMETREWLRNQPIILSKTLTRNEEVGHDVVDSRAKAQTRGRPAKRARKNVPTGN